MTEHDSTHTDWLLALKSFHRAVTESVKCYTYNLPQWVSDVSDIPGKYDSHAQHTS